MCWTGKITDKHIAEAGDMPVYKVLLTKGNRLLLKLVKIIEPTKVSFKI